MASSSSLRIAVLGVGKIGSTFAFQLSRSGNHDVTVVARPGSERLKQLQRDNGIVNVKGERAEVRVTDALDEQTPYDLVIVTMPAYQVDAVLPALRCSAAPMHSIYVGHLSTGATARGRQCRALLLWHAVCAGHIRR